MAVDVANWKPELHPRDSHGRFRDSWKLSAIATRIVDGILKSFNASEFKSDKHAEGYLRRVKVRPRSKRQNESISYFYSPEGRDSISSALQAGYDPRESLGPSAQIKDLDDMMEPLPHDMLLTWVGDGSQFGLPPERLDEIEEWTGKIVTSKDFTATNLTTPETVPQSHVTWSILAPHGTRGVVVGDGYRDVILDREQPLQIMKVEKDGRGGIYVYATAMPRRGSGVARNLGKELPEREKSPAVEATPEELAKRGLDANGNPLPKQLPPAGTPAPGERGLPPHTPVQSVPAEPQGSPVEQIKQANGEVKTGQGRVTREEDLAPEAPAEEPKPKPNPRQVIPEEQARLQEQQRKLDERQRQVDEQQARVARAQERLAQSQQKQIAQQQDLIGQLMEREKGGTATPTPEAAPAPAAAPKKAPAAARRSVRGPRVADMTEAQKDDVVRADERHRRDTPDYPRNSEEHRLVSQAREIRRQRGEEGPAPASKATTPVEAPPREPGAARVVSFPRSGPNARLTEDEKNDVLRREAKARAERPNFPENAADRRLEEQANRIREGRESTTRAAKRTEQKPSAKLVKAAQKAAAPSAGAKAAAARLKGLDVEGDEGQLIRTARQQILEGDPATAVRKRLDDRAESLRIRAEAPGMEDDPAGQRRMLELADRYEAASKAVGSRGPAAGKIAASDLQPGTSKVLISQHEDGRWVPATKRTGAKTITVSSVDTTRSRGRDRLTIHGRDADGNEFEVHAARNTGNQSGMTPSQRLLVPTEKKVAVKKATKAVESTPEAPEAGAPKKATKALRAPAKAAAEKPEVTQAKERLAKRAEKKAAKAVPSTDAGSPDITPEVAETAPVLTPDFTRKTGAKEYRPTKLVKHAVFEERPANEETVIEPEWGGEQRFKGTWVRVVDPETGKTKYGSALDEWMENNEKVPGTDNGWVKVTPVTAYQHKGEPRVVETRLKDGTHETNKVANAGDWIVRQPNGEVQVVDDAEFKSRYEADSPQSIGTFDRFKAKAAKKAAPAVAKKATPTKKAAPTKKAVNPFNPPTDLSPVDEQELQMNKEQLLIRAERYDIPGRENMSRDELIQALRTERPKREAEARARRDAAKAAPAKEASATPGEKVTAAQLDRGQRIMLARGADGKWGPSDRDDAVPFEVKGLGRVANSRGGSRRIIDVENEHGDKIRLDSSPSLRYRLAPSTEAKKTAPEPAAKEGSATTAARARLEHLEAGERARLRSKMNSDQRAELRNLSPEQRESYWRHRIDHGRDHDNAVFRAEEEHPIVTKAPEPTSTDLEKFRDTEVKKLNEYQVRAIASLHPEAEENYWKDRFAGVPHGEALVRAKDQDQNLRALQSAEDASPVAAARKERAARRQAEAAKSVTPEQEHRRAEAAAAAERLNAREEAKQAAEDAKTKTVTDQWLKDAGVDPDTLSEFDKTALMVIGDLVRRRKISKREAAKRLRTNRETPLNGVADKLDPRPETAATRREQAIREAARKFQEELQANGPAIGRALLEAMEDQPEPAGTPDEVKKAPKAVREAASGTMPSHREIQDAPELPAPTRKGLHQIRLPDGSMAERTSQTRKYTHAVLTRQDNRIEADQLDQRAADHQEALEAFIEARKTGDWSKFEKVVRSYQGNGQKGYGLRYTGNEGRITFHDQDLTTRNNSPDNWLGKYGDTPEKVNDYWSEASIKSVQSGIESDRKEAARLRRGPAESYYISRWSSNKNNATRALGSQEIRSGPAYSSRVVEVGRDYSGAPPGVPGRKIAGVRHGMPAVEAAGTRSASKPPTLAELRKQATDAKIPGRSRMTRPQLEEALRKHNGAEESAPMPRGPLKAAPAAAVRHPDRAAAGHLVPSRVRKSLLEKKTAKQRRDYLDSLDLKSATEARTLARDLGVKGMSRSNVDAIKSAIDANFTPPPPSRRAVTPSRPDGAPRVYRKGRGDHGNRGSTTYDWFVDHDGKRSGPFGTKAEADTHATRVVRDKDLNGKNKTELLAIANKEGVPSPGRFNAEQLREQIAKARDVGDIEPGSVADVDNGLRDLGLPTSASALRRLAGKEHAIPGGSRMSGPEYKKEFLRRVRAGGMKPVPEAPNTRPTITRAKKAVKKAAPEVQEPNLTDHEASRVDAAIERLKTVTSDEEARKLLDHYSDDELRQIRHKIQSPASRLAVSRTRDSETRGILVNRVVNQTVPEARAAEGKAPVVAAQRDRFWQLSPEKRHTVRNLVGNNTDDKDQWQAALDDVAPTKDTVHGHSVKELSERTGLDKADTPSLVRLADQYGVDHAPGASKEELQRAILDKALRDTKVRNRGGGYEENTLLEVQRDIARIRARGDREFNPDEFMRAMSRVEDPNVLRKAIEDQHLTPDEINDLADRYGVRVQKSHGTELKEGVIARAVAERQGIQNRDRVRAVRDAVSRRPKRKPGQPASDITTDRELAQDLVDEVKKSDKARRIGSQGADFQDGTGSDVLGGLIAREQGFDAHPTPVTTEEFDQLAKDKQLGQVLFRGVKGYEAWNGRSGKTAAEMHDELRTGPHRFGNGIFGNGIYMATTKRHAESPEYNDKTPGAVGRYALRRDAKVVNWDDLVREHSAFLSARKPGDPDYDLNSDIGRYAAASGYDAIRIPKGTEPGVGRPAGGNQYVVLNRGALISDVPEGSRAMEAIRRRQASGGPILPEAPGESRAVAEAGPDSGPALRVPARASRRDQGGNAGRPVGAAARKGQKAAAGNREAARAVGEGDRAPGLEPEAPRPRRALAPAGEPAMATTGAQVRRAPTRKVRDLKEGDRLYTFVGRYGAQAKPPAPGTHGLDEAPSPATITRITPDGRIRIRTDGGFEGELFAPSGGALRPNRDTVHVAPPAPSKAVSTRAARPVKVTRAATKATKATAKVPFDRDTIVADIRKAKSEDAVEKMLADRNLTVAQLREIATELGPPVSSRGTKLQLQKNIAAGTAGLKHRPAAVFAPKKRLAAGGTGAAPKKLTARELEEMSTNDIVRAARDGHASRPMAAKAIRSHADAKKKFGPLTVGSARGGDERARKERLEAVQADVDRLRALADAVEVGTPVKATREAAPKTDKQVPLAELRRQATEAKIPGRSRMTRAQLEEALAKPSAPAAEPSKAVRAAKKAAPESAQKKLEREFTEELGKYSGSTLISVAPDGFEYQRPRVRQKIGVHTAYLSPEEMGPRDKTRGEIIRELAQRAAVDPAYAASLREKLAKERQLTPGRKKAVPGAGVRGRGEHDIDAVPARLGAGAGQPLRWKDGQVPEGWDVERQKAASRALREYNGASYVTNFFLRGLLPEDPPPQIVRNIGALDDLMSVSKLDRDVEAWRGLRAGREMFGTDAFDGDLAGHEWHDLGFGSTSARRSVSRAYADGPDGVLMRVRVPKDTGVAQVQDMGSEGDFFPRKAEMLVERGARYRVVKDHGPQPEGYRLLDVELVPPRGKPPAPGKKDTRPGRTLPKAVGEPEKLYRATPDYSEISEARAPSPYPHVDVAELARSVGVNPEATEYKDIIDEVQKALDNQGPSYLGNNPSPRAIAKLIRDRRSGRALRGYYSREREQAPKAPYESDAEYKLRQLKHRQETEAHERQAADYSKLADAVEKIRRRRLDEAKTKPQDLDEQDLDALAQIQRRRYIKPESSPLGPDTDQQARLERLTRDGYLANQRGFYQITPTGRGALERSRAERAARKTTPTRAAAPATDVVQRLRDAKTEQEAIGILAGDPSLTASKLRKVADDLGIDVPASMRAKSSLQLHIAERVSASKALPSGADIQVVPDIKDLSPRDIAQGHHLTPAGRRALDSLGAAGHPRLAAIDDPEQKIREAFRMLAVPGAGGDHYVALSDVRKLIGDQASRKDVDDALRRLFHADDVRLSPQSYARENATVRMPAAIRIGGRDLDGIHIDDPSLARPKQFSAVDIAQEIVNRRDGKPGDPMMAGLSDADLNAEMGGRLADPITARDVAAEVPEYRPSRPIKAAAKATSAPAASDYEARQTKLAGFADRKPTKTTKPTGGSRSDVRIEEHGDEKVVRKTHRDARDTDAEILAPEVIEAFGGRSAATTRTGDRSVLMEHIPGQTYEEKYPGLFSDEDLRRYTDTDEGVLTGLADYVMGNDDRNEGNWVSTPDGHIVAIDNDSAFKKQRGIDPPASFFGEFLQDPRTRDLRDQIDVSPEDLALIRTRLRKLKPKFDAAGRSAWYRGMDRRLKELEKRAAGTKRRIHGPDDKVPAAKAVPERPVKVTRAAAKKAAPAAAPTDEMASLRNDYDAAVRLRTEAFDRDGQAGWNREDKKVQEAGERLAAAGQKRTVAMRRIKDSVPAPATAADHKADSVAKSIESSGQTGNSYRISGWLDGLDAPQKRRVARRLGMGGMDSVPDGDLTAAIVDTLTGRRPWSPDTAAPSEPKLSLAALAKEVGIRGDAAGIVPGRQHDLDSGMSRADVAAGLRLDADRLEKTRLEQSSSDPHINQVARRERADAVQKLRDLADRVEGKPVRPTKKAAPAKKVVPVKVAPTPSAPAAKETAPNPPEVPVARKLSTKPLIHNNWGGTGGEVSFHADGPVGRGLERMGEDQFLDVDGEPLGNVIGKMATDSVRGKTSTKEFADRLRGLRDKVPYDSSGRRRLDEMIEQVDPPEKVDLPHIPDDTPEPLKELARSFADNPLTRRATPPRGSGGRGQPLEELAGIIRDFHNGDEGGSQLIDRVEKLHNRYHESLGAEGKDEMDRAVLKAVKELNAIHHDRARRHELTDKLLAKQKGKAAPNPPASTVPRRGEGETPTVAKLRARVEELQAQKPHEMSRPEREEHFRQVEDAEHKLLLAQPGIGRNGLPKDGQGTSTPQFRPPATVDNPQSAWGKARDNVRFKWSPNGRPANLDQVDRVYTADSREDARKFLERQSDSKLQDIADAADLRILTEDRDKRIDRIIDGIREPERGGRPRKPEEPTVARAPEKGAVRATDVPSESQLAQPSKTSDPAENARLRLEAREAGARRQRAMGAADLANDLDRIIEARRGDRNSESVRKAIAERLAQAPTGDVSNPHDRGAQGAEELRKALTVSDGDSASSFRNKLRSALARRGITFNGNEGDRVEYDPDKHDLLEGADIQPGQMAEIHRPGLTFQDKTPPRAARTGPQVSTKPGKWKSGDGVPTSLFLASEGKLGKGFKSKDLASLDRDVRSERDHHKVPEEYRKLDAALAAAGVGPDERPRKQLREWFNSTFEVGASAAEPESDGAPSLVTLRRPVLRSVRGGGGGAPRPRGAIGPVPEPRKAAGELASRSLESLTMRELRDRLPEGMLVPSRIKKAELVDLIRGSEPSGRHHVTETPQIRALRRSVRSGTTDEKVLGNGTMGRVTRTKTSDGKTVIRKQLRSVDDFDLDPEAQADAETLVSRLGHEIGAPVVPVYQSGPRTVHMGEAKGKLGLRATPKELERAVQSEKGKKLHLLDLVTGQIDRGPENFMIDEHGNPLAYDHSLAFQPTLRRKSRGAQEFQPSIMNSMDPFHAHYQVARGRYDEEGVGLGAHRWASRVPWTTEELEQARAAVVKLQPEFEAKGREDWYEEALGRVDALIKRAKDAPRAPRTPSASKATPSAAPAKKAARKATPSVSAAPTRPVKKATGAAQPPASPTRERPTIRRAGTSGSGPKPRQGLGAQLREALAAPSDRPLTGRVDYHGIGDLLDTDTGSHGVPVDGLEVQFNGPDGRQYGYRIGRGTAWRHDGTTFVVEHGDTPGETRQAEQAIRELRSHYDSLPRSARAYQRSYTVLQGSNPTNDAFRTRYDLGDDFASVASSSRGSTLVWDGGVGLGGLGHGDVRVKQTLDHEFAHSVDFALPEGLDSGSINWEVAAWSDFETPHVADFQADRGNPLARTVELALSPTFDRQSREFPYGIDDYATSSHHEDFGDSVALYLSDLPFGTGVPAGESTRRPVTFREMFPGRAAHLDQIFPDEAARQKAMTDRPVSRAPVPQRPIITRAGAASRSPESAPQPGRRLDRLLFPSSSAAEGYAGPQQSTLTGHIPVGTGQSGLLAGETWPKAKPVKNLTIQNGYRIPRGSAWHHDGVTYVVQHGDTPQERERVQATVRALMDYHSALPEDMKRYQRSYTMVDGENPRDVETRKRFGYDDSMQSAMSATNGNTIIWNRGSSSPDEFSESLDHELGHNTSDHAGLLGAQSGTWHDAGKSDHPVRSEKYSGFRPVDHRLTRGLVIGPRSNNYPNGVTSYGTSSPDEDFAESVALYRFGPLGLAQSRSTGEWEPVWFRDLFPERAAVLDQLYPQLSAEQTADIARVRAMAMDRRSRAAGLRRLVGSSS